MRNLKADVPKAEADFSFLLSKFLLLSRWLPLALFSVLWLDLIRLLSGNWEAREQYAYGWFVPFLALALFWKRWMDRPERRLEGPQDHRTTGPQDQRSEAGGQWSVVSGPAVSGPAVPSTSPAALSSISHLPSSPPLGPVVSSLVVLSAALLLPLRVIFEINTDWPLIAWAYTIIVVALTLYAFHLAGPGPSPLRLDRGEGQGEVSSCSSGPPSTVHRPPSFGLWSVVRGPLSLIRSPWSAPSPWVRHFAFPVAFILVALVWPYRIEKGLTQNLMQWVASLTVEIIGWFGIPAFQRGNLIEVATGVVGVDEACSGIRSFQSTLMAGLFLGELYRLKWTRRISLVLIGLILAFGFNVVRTLILTWQASSNGISAIDKWHDPAGMIIFLISFACLWALAGWLKWKTTDHGLRTTDHRPRTTDHGPQTTGPRDHKSEVSSQWSVVQPTRYLVAVGFWSLLCLLATEVWYRSHDKPDSGFFHWTVAMPQNNVTYQKIELPPRTLKLLSFDEGASGKWTEDGVEWSIHFFRWKPKSIQSVIQSRIHRPERCLPASGLRQVADSGVANFEAAGLQLPFRQYSYEAEGRTLHVFFCQWEDGSERQTGMAASNQEGRMRSVLVGRRKLGQQTLEVILTGPATLDEGAQKLRGQLPALIRAEAPAQAARAGG